MKFRSARLVSSPGAQDVCASGYAFCRIGDEQMMESVRRDDEAHAAGARHCGSQFVGETDRRMDHQDAVRKADDRHARGKPDSEIAQLLLRYPEIVCDRM